MKVVASLTTIPSRLPLIEQCLRSILSDDDFDQVILNVPLKSLKGVEYSEETLEQYRRDLGGRLVVNRIPQDLGPITKLVGGLDYVTDPETLIVVFDDDRELIRPCARLFKEKVTESPSTVYSFGGWSYGGGYRVHVSNKTDVEVDSVMGTTCIAFQRKLIEKTELLNFHSDDHRLLRLDDLRISGYLASKNIRRVSIGRIAREYLRDIEYPGTESLSTNVRFWLDNKGVIDKLYREGLFKLSSLEGFSVEWFVLLIIISLILTLYGLFATYTKRRFGYGSLISGVIIGIVAFLQVSSSML